MKSKKRVLITSLTTIALSAALIGGSTYALFTSESKASIAVTSGKVEIVATAELTKAWSASWIDEDSAYGKTGDEGAAHGALEADADGNYTFLNKGTASYDEATNIVTLERVTPGDGVQVKVDITNFSNVATQYKINVAPVAGKDDGLFEALTMTATTDSEGETDLIVSWQPLEPAADPENGDELDSIYVDIELPVAAGDKYQQKSCEIAVTVEAVQGNAHIVEVAEFMTALAGEGDVTLTNDIDLDGTAVLDVNGKRTLDLNGNTISYANGAANVSALKVDAKNLEEDAEISICNGTIESNGYGVAIFGLQGATDKTVTVNLENVNVKASSAAFATNGSYKNGVKIVAKDCTFEGGVGAYLPANAEYTFTNCTFKGESGVVLRSGNVTFTNCTIEGTAEYEQFAYFPSGAYGTNGSAIVIPGSGDEYGKLSLTINGGKLISAHGYGIEDFCGLPMTNGGTNYSNCHIETLKVNGVTATCVLGQIHSMTEVGANHNEAGWVLSWKN